MSIQADRLAYLWDGFINKKATEKELDELFEELNHPADNPQIYNLFEQYFNTPVEGEAFDKEYWLDKLPLIKKKVVAEPELQKGKLVPVFNRSWVRIAAAVVIVLGTAFYFTVSRKNSEDLNHPITVVQDIKPGGKHAILTLGNGSIIILDSSKTGLIATQGSTSISKANNGQVTYLTQTGSSSEISQNTLTTPNGAQYQVTLADGTNVWLNAASSITYPTSFTGNERNVSITGEAYFEVAKDKLRSFTVTFMNEKVQVLGTHFNINSYTNEENFRTTLLEGSIRLFNSTSAGILKPGQQAITNGRDNKISIVETDAEQAVAWKNGIFKFNDVNLVSVMHQLERWYGVNVKYEGIIPGGKFSGGTVMNVNLSEVLKVLELNGIHCRIEGKTIVVHQ